MISKLINKIESANKFHVGALALAIQVAIFFPIAWLQLINSDEGFYLLAAKYVMAGKTLYRDFFFPQMPLLPYVYGLWMKVFGFTWYSARSLSAVLAILLGSLIYLQVTTLFRRRVFGLLAVIIYASSSFVFGFYSLAKTYSLSTLLLFGAYILLERRLWLVCGLLFGLAVDARLFFIAVIPAFLIGIHYSEGEIKGRTVAYRSFLIGVLIAILPNLAFILINPENFFFSIIGNHSIRSEYGLIGDFTQKGIVVLRLFGIQWTEGVISFQFLILCLINFYYFLLNIVLKKRLAVSLYITLFLFFVSLLPTPVWIEYFSVLIPFMIITSLYVFAEGHWSLKSFLIMILCLYVFVAPLNSFRYAFRLKEIAGEELRLANLINWQIPTVDKISLEIEKNVGKNELVASGWPGYFIQPDRTLLPGMEYPYLLQTIWPRVDENKLDKYKIISPARLKEVFEKHQVRLVVWGNCAIQRPYRKIILASGYSLVKTIGDTEIFLYPRSKKRSKD